ncbi:hypothetical protein KY361_04885 [Candidatus Woesearchaeota archaeon]|nr:hypothetical protein [Candidatus Woesearchaeota archaeon]
MGMIKVYFLIPDREDLAKAVSAGGLECIARQIEKGVRKGKLNKSPRGAARQRVIYASLDLPEIVFGEHCYLSCWINENEADVANFSLRGYPARYEESTMPVREHQRRVEIEKGAPRHPITAMPVAQSEVEQIAEQFKIKNPISFYNPTVLVRREHIPLEEFREEYVPGVMDHFDGKRRTALDGQDPRVN